MPEKDSLEARSPVSTVCCNGLAVEVSLKTVATRATTVAMAVVYFIFNHFQACVWRTTEWIRDTGGRNERGKELKDEMSQRGCLWE